MNTTTAATQAHVTTATIRTWARRGVIAATKRAGRWIIDAASLAHRIAIAALKTRKAAAVTQPTEPVEIRIDDETTIRAHQATNPAYGTTTWFAYKHINGWQVGIPTSGATAEAAITAMQRLVDDEQRNAAALEALEDSGIYADMTGTRPMGILRTLDSLTPTPHTGDHDCRYCGLDDRTCDCR
jgi:hypothetical protein